MIVQANRRRPFALGAARLRTLEQPPVGCPAKPLHYLEEQHTCRVIQRKGTVAADVRSLLYKVVLITILVGMVALWVFRNSWMSTPTASGVGFMRPFLVGWNRLSDSALHLAGIGKRREQARLDELETEVARLQVAMGQIQDLQKESRELRELLDLPRPPGWRFVAAQVIAREPATWQCKFRVDRGQGDGIEAGDAVLAGGGIVGRVGECTATTSTVVTVLDRNCRLSVVVGRQAVPGILVGRNGRVWRTESRCQVDYLPRDVNYEAGDAVHTSGLGLHVPGGLPVGSLITQPDGTVATTIDSIYSQALMQPLVDVADVSRVVIVTRSRRTKGRTAKSR